MRKAIYSLLYTVGDILQKVVVIYSIVIIFPQKVGRDINGIKKH